jgi:hypothetical protein
MSPLDLSFQVKLPLWGAVLILLTAFAVSTASMVQSYEELGEDQAIEADILSHALVSIIFPLMLHDNVWRVFESIKDPVREGRNNRLESVESIVVVDKKWQVFASSRPKDAPVLGKFADLGPDHAWVKANAGTIKEGETVAVAPPRSRFIYFLTPVAQSGETLGTLVVISDRDAFLPRFSSIAWHVGAVGGVVLAVLLPFNWYWGQRMARPLVELTKRMGTIGKAMPDALDPRMYGHRDELGKLFDAYNQMLEACLSGCHPNPLPVVC